MLPLIGQSLPKSSVVSLSPIIQSCCKDLLSSLPILNAQPSVPATKGKSNANQASTNADNYLMDSGMRSQKPPITSPELHGAAVALLPIFFSDLPQACISKSLRALLDR